MEMFQAIAAELEEARFRLLLKGSLRQREVPEAIVFQGVAHIDQDAQGGLALRFVCESASDSFDQEEGLPEPPQGVSTAESFYFDLSGMDGDGTTWKAERILVRLDRPSKDWGFPTRPEAFDVALGQIPELVTSRPIVTNDSQRSHVAWVLPGLIASPRQSMPKTWTHDADGLSWSVDQDKQGNTEVRFHSQTDGFETATRHFFRALSVLTSEHLQPRCSATIVGDVESVSIFSRKQEVSPQPILWIPMRFMSGWELFLVTWMGASRDADARKMELDGRAIQDVIYHFWYRFYRAYAVDMENGAQVLTSSIEGMAKRYFSNVPISLLTEREQEFTVTMVTLEQADRKKHTRTINILKGKIDNEGRKRPDIDLLLDSLCHTKHVTEAMVEAWGNLRNDAAHGDHLVKSSDDIQKFERDFFQCFEAFKRLCMFAINYDGPAQDFSVEGWPVLRNTTR